MDEVSPDGTVPSRRKPVERRPAASRPAAAPPAGAKPAPARPAAAKPAVARPAAAKPATKPPATKAPAPKPAPKKVAEEAEDDFSSLVPREPTSVALPPKVVKKKKAEKTVSQRRRASSDGPSDPAEVLVPAILILVGLGMNVVAAMLYNPFHLTSGYAIVGQFALVAVAAVATLGALFLAASVLDMSYGVLHTAILKVIAITITQAWVSDLSSLIGFWHVEWLICFGTTFAMFKYLFELDDIEVIYSMIVVRMVYWTLAVFVLAGVIAAVFAGTISIPDRMIGPAAFEAGAFEDGDIDMDDDPDIDAEGAVPPPGMNPAGNNPAGINPQGEQSMPPDDDVEE